LRQISSTTGEVISFAENCVLVEAKAVEKILSIHKAQLLSYMKLPNIPVGLLINFHERKITDGISA
jgi:GxxExxY protein